MTGKLTASAATTGMASNSRRLIRSPRWRAGEQRVGYSQAQQLCCLEIDDKLVLCRLLHGQLTWSFAFEDFVHVGSSAAIHIDKIRTVAHQAACLRELPKRGH